MSGSKIAVWATLGVGAALVLSGCDNGPSAVSQSQAAGDRMATAPAAGDFAADAGNRDDQRKAPVKLVEGRPMWSASRKFSAQENAERAFERNGATFGADSVEAFVRKAHAFVRNPPKGTLTLTRANGDTLFYDPKGNVFAVASKEGAPRTMFKPDDGMAYWEEQKAREARRQATRRDRGDGDA